MTHQNYTIPLNEKNLLLAPLPTSPIKTITRVNSTVKDLFIYLYDLSPLELDLLFILIKNKKSMTLEELAKKVRSEEHTSELQSPDHLVCRLLLEKKK